MFENPRSSHQVVNDSSLRAVIFDMDGVLIDSERLHMRADAETFQKYGMEIPDEAWDDIFGMKSEEGLALMLERYGDGSQNPYLLASEKRARYLELAGDALDLVPGVREYLEMSRHRFEKMAVTTSGQSRVQMPLLDRFGIRNLFDVIVTGDLVKVGKPDPEPYMITVSELGLSPRECLVVEDAVAGVQSAKAAGCVVIGLATTLSGEWLMEAGADVVVQSFSELMKG